MPGDNFASRLEGHGERLAVVLSGGRRLTYLELAAQADAFARGRESGPMLIAVEAANELEPLVAYLSALRRGDPVLLLPSGDHPQHGAIIETYRPDLLVVRRDGRWIVEAGAGSRPALNEELAVLLSTSGSTGAVKLVRLAGSAIDSNAASIVDYLGITPDDRALTTLPIHYCYGLSVVNSHLSCGAAVLLTDKSVADPELWAFCEKEGATSFAGVPYTFELLDRIGFQAKTLPTLRTVTQAGGRLPPETACRYAEWAQDRGVRLFVMYGQTEATARMSFVPPQSLPENLDSIGIPIPGGAFRLIDEAGHDINRPGETGELVYRGPNVMMGYAASAEDLAKGAELQELNTGDLAQRDAKGFYRIVGRKSRFSKLFGLRLSLDEIEAGLARRGLSAAAAGDDALIAIAVEGGKLPDRLSEDLAAQYGVPAASFDIDPVDSLPRLASGKVDYQAILDTGRDRNRRRAAAVDKGVAAAFQRAFPAARLKGSDTFISLGGDSLSYVTLAIELESQLGALPERWEEHSLRQLQALAAHVERPSWWQGRAIESEVLIRALAIIGVVIAHTASGLVVGGGAEVLLMLSGYNLSRYQRLGLVEGRGPTILASFLKRIIAPYYVILIVYLLWKREVDLPSLFLVSNFVGRFHSFLEPYWFLEALTQCLLVVVVAFSLRPVRDMAARDPWSLGLWGLTAALAVKLILFAMLGHAHLLNRSLDGIFYMIALGWCLHQATTPRRKIVLTAVILVIAALDVFGPPQLWSQFPRPSNWTHALWLAAAGGVMLWTPRVVLPNAVRAAVALVAAASFYIYLTHGVILHLLIWVAGLDSVIIALTAALAGGLATWFIVQKRSRVAVPAESISG